MMRFDKKYSHHVTVCMGSISEEVLLVWRPDAILRSEHGLVLRLLLLLGLWLEEHPLLGLLRGKARGHLHHGTGTPALHQPHEVVKSRRRVGRD
jgi:hypothetical protein